MSGSCLKTVLKESENDVFASISIWFSPGILISTGSSIVVTFISGLLRNL